MNSSTLHPDSLNALQQIAEHAKKKIVFVNGLFNVLHPGHLRMLRFASECGNSLVVGVQESPDGEPHVLDENSRLESIKATTWVDHAFILRDPPENFIAALKPDVVVKGVEHEDMHNPELEVVKGYGGKLLFNSGDVSYSLAELLRSESDRISSMSFPRQEEFMRRHNVTISSLQDIIHSFADLRVMVLGEIIVDEYISCEPLGMSQEEPALVVSPVSTSTYLGGAGIVASHARTMGAEVAFFSVSGDDETARFAEKSLEQNGIASFVFKDETRPTILKQRYRSQGKSLLRVNHLRQHPLNKELQACLFEKVLHQLDQTDLVVFSDFNYGVLPSLLVDKIIDRCRKAGIMMVADSQSSSQVGDISRFQHMRLITPTEREARLALRDFESGLVVLAEKLRKKALAESVIVTLNKAGILIQDDGSSQLVTDRLSAMNSNAADPAGAGDSFLIASALALAAGGSIWQSSYIGSLAAACQVERVGNIPIHRDELLGKLIP